MDGMVEIWTKASLEKDLRSVKCKHHMSARLSRPPLVKHHSHAHASGSRFVFDSTFKSFSSVM